jgi:hypothetical protein
MTVVLANPGFDTLDLSTYKGCTRQSGFPFACLVCTHPNFNSQSGFFVDLNGGVATVILVNPGFLSLLVTL